MQDEKAVEQKGGSQGGSLLGRRQTGSRRKSWQGMPQVKELKELKVAGPATKRVWSCREIRI